MMQPNNGIFIATWYEDPQDTALFELMPLLEELIMTRTRVPDILNKYREQIPAWAGFGRWDDCGFDGPQVVDTPPPQQQQQFQQQPQYTQPEAPPQRSAPAAANSNQMASMGQQGAAAPEPSRVYGTGPVNTGPSPPYSQQQQGQMYQQSGMSAPGGMNPATSGYPDQQALGPQTAVPKAAQQQVQTRQMAFSGVAGPYQQAQSMGQPRQAFGGIAGPYQASLSRPAGHA